MNGGALNSRGFTVRESLLIADYLRTKGANATESALRAGYRGNRNTLGVIAFETLRRPKIAREIKRRLMSKISTAEIESEIAEVALTKTPIDAPAKMKALDLLAKINGMITAKTEVTDTSERDGTESAILKSIERTAEKAGITQESAAKQLYLAGKDDAENPLSNLANFPAQFREILNKSDDFEPETVSEASQ